MNSTGATCNGSRFAKYIGNLIKALARDTRSLHVLISGGANILLNILEKVCVNAPNVGAGSGARRLSLKA